MTLPDKSFSLDRRGRSFRVSDFALRDMPFLALAVIALTAFSLIVGFFVEFLPQNGRWVCVGLGIGFYLGTVVGSWGQRRTSPVADPVRPS